jgi:hypothetical protein
VSVGGNLPGFLDFLFIVNLKFGHSMSSSYGEDIFFIVLFDPFVLYCFEWEPVGKFRFILPLS